MLLWNITITSAPPLHQGNAHFEICRFDVILNHKSKPQLLEDPDKSLLDPAAWSWINWSVEEGFQPVGCYHQALFYHHFCVLVLDRAPGAGRLMGGRQRGTDYTESVRNGDRAAGHRRGAVPAGVLALAATSLQFRAPRSILELSITLGGSYLVTEGADCISQSTAS